MEENREPHSREYQEIAAADAKVVTEKTVMGSISGNDIAEVPPRDPPQQQSQFVVGQQEDEARLRLMEISKVVPPAEEAELNEEEHYSHSYQSPQSSSSSSSSPSSLSPRPNSEDEIRRKLMSISYSFDQPLSNPGQPVAG